MSTQKHAAFRERFSKTIDYYRQRGMRTGEAILATKRLLFGREPAAQAARLRALLVEHVTPADLLAPDALLDACRLLIALGVEVPPERPS